ncbi:hypothetical protein GC101_31165 [Paenibacillus sp. LMG 31459]|uniref:Uncharacterized protein n=1 Tax=Paenibacillus phytohabitans TaxID=2654978 RepID=A0ABX1YQH9_9BACL|nr:hypothetical protein [Paenibacillus phytohabitans]NOU83323.1 hypothetical protein [Paenibacillus phytohabitans]
MQKSGEVMVESFLDYSLGPYGRALGALLFKYQFPVNCAIFAFVVFSIIRKLHIRRKEQVNKHD